MTREELAKEVNEIWELYVKTHDLGDEIDKRLRELKYNVVKNLTIPDVVGESEQLVCPHCGQLEPCAGNSPEPCYHPKVC